MTVTIGEWEPLNWTPAIDWVSPGTESLTMGSGTVITASSTNAPVMLPSNALQPYLVQAAEWGREAGEQWVRDLENHFAIQTITGSTTGSENLCFYPQRELTPKQAEEAGRRRRESEYRSDRASWKARALLVRNLTRRQREELEGHGRFTVKTKRGHRYVIGRARAQNVVRVNRRGTPMRVYCVSVGGRVPVEDSMLAQALMLRHDEDHFLRVARQWPVRFALGVRGLADRSGGWLRLSDQGLWTPGITINEAA